MDVKVKNAIISVSDKTGLLELARGLHELGVRLYSTGGTAKSIEESGIPVVKISDYTGFPEIMDGRVKSLHPKIHGGILARRDSESHMDQLRKSGIVEFDLVAINLYPFEKVMRKPGAGVEEVIENIDIGGPSMLRSSAKNYEFVCVLADPADYRGVLDELKSRGGVSLRTRKRCAMKAFERTSFYDGLIAGYFRSSVAAGLPDGGEPKFPPTVSFHFEKKQDLRYGENPHQGGAFYEAFHAGLPAAAGVVSARQLRGKELSFNNILDIEAAIEIVKEFDGPACTVIKHTNPCGTAVASNLRQAFLDAWDGDPVSAFGGIVGLNRAVGVDTAEAISAAGFVECVVAPGFDGDALELLGRKQNVRILETGPVGKNESYDFDMKRVVGGLILQERDLSDFGGEDSRLVTKRDASASERLALRFAWKVAKHVKSNAIVLAVPTGGNAAKTVGVGAGQMSRVDATFIAVSKAKERARGAVLASDAFFPKADAVELAVSGGVTALIQPGGSLGDEEAIRACDTAGAAMLFTGFRHFKH
jgi:phosphoribosylaminoimidazolecarboxamide formyltransferase/IMP cyclohydrolase